MDETLQCIDVKTDISIRATLSSSSFVCRGGGLLRKILLEPYLLEQRR